eukprot:9267233-Lingulodinium_polyedra.AAC.1
MNSRAIERAFGSNAELTDIQSSQGVSPYVCDFLKMTVHAMLWPRLRCSMNSRAIERAFGSNAELTDIQSSQGVTPCIHP